MLATGVGHTVNSLIAGWSSPVARQAHNLKVAGSNPAPATNYNYCNNFGRAPRQRTASRAGHFCIVNRAWENYFAKTLDFQLSIFAIEYQHRILA